LGRRRPYILTGAIFVIIALILIPNSLDIGRWFGDTPGKHPVALVLAVAGFWILDFANNMLQGPCRALVADIAGPEQQELGNSIFSLWIALGSVTGYIAGWISWSEYISFMRTEACQAACEDLRVSFIISIVLLIVTTIITLVSAKERPLDEIDDELNRTKQPPSPTGEEHESIKKVNPILKMLSILFKMPQPMLRVCFVQFFAWFGWFTFLIYGTDWVGENIYHGNPDSKHPAYHLYQEGVRWGSFGLAGFAFVSLIFSPIVPALTNRFGTKPVYFVCNALLVVALFLPVIVRNKYVALLTLSLFGIPWSITMTIPFAIVANIAPEEEKGIYMGILNIFVVLPQLCMSAVGALLSYLSNGNVVSAFGAGAVSAFLACLLTLFLIIPTKMHKKKKKRKPSKTQEQLLTLTAQSTPGSPTTVYSNV
jgi:solute carrier family 45 protein 1/2/4